jgi:hypothetical protein
MKLIPFDLGEVTVTERNIVSVTLLKNGEVDESMIVQLIKATIQLSEGKPYAILLDFNGKNVPSTALAKQLVAARNTYESMVLARAIVDQNLKNNTEINNFIRHHKPEVETRVFKTKTEALTWLDLVMLSKKSN